eukprot:EG_transcript_21032
MYPPPWGWRGFGGCPPMPLCLLLLAAFMAWEGRPRYGALHLRPPRWNVAAKPPLHRSLRYIATDRPRELPGVPAGLGATRFPAEPLLDLGPPTFVTAAATGLPGGLVLVSVTAAVTHLVRSWRRSARNVGLWLDVGRGAARQALGHTRGRLQDLWARWLRPAAHEGLDGRTAMFAASFSLQAYAPVSKELWQEFSDGCQVALLSPSFSSSRVPPQPRPVPKGATAAPAKDTPSAPTVTETLTMVQCTSAATAPSPVGPPEVLPLTAVHNTFDELMDKAFLGSRVALTTFSAIKVPSVDPTAPPPSPP